MNPDTIQTILAVVAWFLAFIGTIIVANRLGKS